MSVLGAMLGVPGDARLIVGIEDDPDGSLRVYVGARYTGIHTHVLDEEAKEDVRRAWPGWGHLFADIPAAALCDCPPPSPSIDGGAMG